ncbi:putative inorganic phosphate cotransporter [Lucilia cuprina]|uniref:putative inorganic phosphate cotransporter n=1 Tax=Lucilia cuprina TaxID=7375 RepID=UPI001F066DDB|nr:putative inorganic phosphate cotransporter [Lucilia cuprina]
MQQTLNKPQELYQTRYFVTFMLFLGMANAYVMRTNMSVAIVAMVNNTAITETSMEELESECPNVNLTAITITQDGPYVWSSQLQGYILASFFYGYVMTQVPFGVLAKRYGALNFLGYGMLLNSLMAFLVPLSTRLYGVWGLCVARFIQGLGEGPIVPCTHALLAKWIPPNERSRMGAAVYSGAQFGTIISMPISGILAEHGGWSLIFYVFGFAATIWCLAFLLWVYEEPNTHPSIRANEKEYINNSIWGSEPQETSKLPLKAIMKSLPFYGILFAHIGQNYGYETLLTELPTYMKQVLRFSLKSNGFYSSLPYLCMWLFSLVIAVVADWMISSQRFSISATRKLMNSIGQYGPGIALATASFTGCNRVLTLFILSLGVGLNGAIYSGFKINHLDIAPHYAGFLMAVTNCTANFVGLFAPIVSGHLVHNEPTIANWRMVFLVATVIYFAGATVFNVLAKAERQTWDSFSNNNNDDDRDNNFGEKVK